MENKDIDLELLKMLSELAQEVNLGKAHFVVGNEVFNNIITARTYRKKNKLNYKVRTIGQSKLPPTQG